jgi:hypothetical protein
VRLSRCEVRDHINYRKTIAGASYRFYRALQRLRSLMRYICEIFGVPRFTSFSTQSANLGNSSAGYLHAVDVNRSDMFHVATSSSRREAVASRRAASRFERARLQCRAPLDDGVIE